MAPRLFKTDEEFYEAYNSPQMQELTITERRLALMKTPADTIKYDPGRPLYNLLKWKATAIGLALHRVELYFFVAMHLLISLLYYQAFDKSSKSNAAGAKGWPKGTIELTYIPGGLLAFMTVFYLNTAYSRYSQQYYRCYGLADELTALALKFRSFYVDDAFPEAKDTRHSLLKLLCAAQLLGYAGLPNNREIRMHLWAFEYVKERQLVAKNQLETLKTLMQVGDGRYAMMEVFLWISRTHWSTVGKRKGSIQEMGLAELNDRIYTARSHLENLYAMAKAPIPFAWFRLINLYMLAYFVLISYFYVFLNGRYWNLLGLVLNIVPFLALRELSSMISDPFGQDVFDIPVFTLALEFERETARLCDQKPFHAWQPPHFLEPDEPGKK